MDGLHCALVGRVGQDAERRYTSNGTALVSVSVMLQDSKAPDAQWIRVGRFFDDDAEAEDLARSLTRGVECYVEGRLRLKTWQGADGSQRSGLDVTAWRIEILGKIGRRAPSRRRTDGELPQQEAA